MCVVFTCRRKNYRDQSQKRNRNWLMPSTVRNANFLIETSNWNLTKNLIHMKMGIPANEWLICVLGHCLIREPSTNVLYAILKKRSTECAFYGCYCVIMFSDFSALTECSITIIVYASSVWRTVTKENGVFSLETVPVWPVKIYIYWKMNTPSVQTWYTKFLTKPTGVRHFTVYLTQFTHPSLALNFPKW